MKSQQMDFTTKVNKQRKKLPITKFFENAKQALTSRYFAKVENTQYWEKQIGIVERKIFIKQQAHSGDFCVSIEIPVCELKKISDDVYQIRDRIISTIFLDVEKKNAYKECDMFLKNFADYCQSLRCKDSETELSQNTKEIIIEINKVVLKYILENIFSQKSIGVLYEIINVGIQKIENSIFFDSKEMFFQVPEVQDDWVICLKKIKENIINDLLVYGHDSRNKIWKLNYEPYSWKDEKDNEGDGDLYSHSIIRFHSSTICERVIEYLKPYTEPTQHIQLKHLFEGKLINSHIVFIGKSIQLICAFRVLINKNLIVYSKVNTIAEWIKTNWKYIGSDKKSKPMNYQNVYNRLTAEKYSCKNPIFSSQDFE